MQQERQWQYWGNDPATCGHKRQNEIVIMLSALSFSLNTAVTRFHMKYTNKYILIKVVGHINLVPCFVLVLISLFLMLVLYL